MQLKSKTVTLRLVEEHDAEFILSLRVDSRYNKFLSPVTQSVKAQQEWILQYKRDEANSLQYYFIIERNDGTPCGTVRVYDISGESFSWGSWILNEDKTKYAALESAFMVYKFGFEELELSRSHFEVRKGNIKVISFHEKMGAVKTGETELDYTFEITRSSVELSREKVSKKLG